MSYQHYLLNVPYPSIWLTMAHPSRPRHGNPTPNIIRELHSRPGLLSLLSPDPRLAQFTCHKAVIGGPLDAVRLLTVSTIMIASRIFLSLPFFVPRGRSGTSTLWTFDRLALVACPQRPPPRDPRDHAVFPVGHSPLSYYWLSPSNHGKTSCLSVQALVFSGAFCSRLALSVLSAFPPRPPLVASSSLLSVRATRIYRKRPLRICQSPSVRRLSSAL
ncbi:hypothetical protein LXA43DRAFT_243702 [Ganoderma leucocontextum]|nr:hypothetical protein LXA43DRAFT_243702 [Ganoderma leucocontextum]